MKRFLTGILVGFLLLAAESAFAQTPVKLWKFRSNLAGADTVAQDTTTAAGMIRGTKIFKIGTAAIGAAAFGTQVGSLQYYDQIAFFLKVDTVSATDTLKITFTSTNYQDSAFVIPVTFYNSLGTPTIDKESTMVAAAGNYTFVINQGAKGIPPMRNLIMRIKIDPSTVARCIYSLSAQASNKSSR